MKEKLKKVFQLFITFIKIGAFTFGGGYAMVPLIQRETVEKKKWINDDDILEIVAIAESTPGPIAVNSATFVGYKTACGRDSGTEEKEQKMDWYCSSCSCSNSIGIWWCGNLLPVSFPESYLYQ